MSSTSDDIMPADHLVVLIHGLWGNPVHLNHLRDTLDAEHPFSNLHILLPKSNSSNFTYDGIEVGAERITHEIEDTIRELEESGNKITKISITGYSLGGLLARYVVGLLYKNELFENIQPVNFTTFATPHIGVRAPSRNYGTPFWNYMGSRTLSTSGQQLFLVDDFRGTGRNLLDIMADPDSAFIAGLRLFKHKFIYANSINDRSVPYYTASFSRTDPFVDLDAVDVHYLEGNDVLLDPHNPVTPRPPPSDSASTLYNQLAIPEKTRKEITFLALFISLLPLTVPLYILNAAYQTYMSAQRIRLHEQGQAFDLKRYRIPLIEEAQAMQDRILERVAAEQTNHAEEYLPKQANNAEQYLPTPPPERSPSVSSSSESISKMDSGRSLEENSPFPLLALTDVQFQMIDNLDQVGFEKFVAHIINVRHTHAAIVVRTPKDTFAEGRAVVSHWAQRFEK